MKTCKKCKTTCENVTNGLCWSCRYVKATKQTKATCETCYGLDDDMSDCEDCNGLGYVDDSMALNDQIKNQEK